MKIESLADCRQFLNDLRADFITEPDDSSWNRMFDIRLWLMDKLEAIEIGYVEIKQAVKEVTHNRYPDSE